MKIHEYQARDLLAQAGIPVPPSIVIDSVDAAAAAYTTATRGLPPTADGKGPLAVVKAQVFAGGRGKAGFVKLVHSPEEATAAARFMLTNRMVSPQTGPEGLAVKKLLIAAGVDIKHEFYIAVTTDRTTRRNILIASREGGVEIEKVAHDRPDAIIKEPLHPTLGLQPFAARNVAFKLGLGEMGGAKLAGQAADIMVKLAKLFVERDCTLAEINPLVLTTASPVPNNASPGPTGGGGRVREAGGGSASSPETRDPKPETRTPTLLAIDAKFTFDDNALFRHKDLEATADHSEDNPAELRAAAAGLSYIALDGNIGCLVNGAGLAMATMDIIKLHGGTPANFLDVGGSATEEAVTEAFKIILSDTSVKGILVNIFGGIMRCDIIAQGVVNAAKQVGFKVPLVVRLEGTNVEAGRQILDNAKREMPTMQAATDLTDAAKKVCAAVG